MFEEIFWIIVYMGISYLLGYLLLSFAPEEIRKFSRYFLMGGIIFHELTHIFMCLITRAPIKSFKLLTREKEEMGSKVKYNYYGTVNLDPKSRFTFLQAFLTALAPAYISYWLLCPLIHILFSGELHPILFILVGFVIITLFMAMRPSYEDLKCIAEAFEKDPDYTIYQIGLSILSFITVIGLGWILGWEYPHEVIFYIFVGFSFYFFKYMFRGVSYLFLEYRKGKQDTEAKHENIPYPYVNRLKRKKYKRKRYDNGQW